MPEEIAVIGGATVGTSVTLYCLVSCCDCCYCCGSRSLVILVHDDAVDVCISHHGYWDGLSCDGVGFGSVVVVILVKDNVANVDGL